MFLSIVHTCVAVSSLKAYPIWRLRFNWILGNLREDKEQEEEIEGIEEEEEEKGKHVLVVS